MSRKIILIKQELLLLVYELNRSGLLAENEKIRPILAQLEKLLLCDLEEILSFRMQGVEFDNGDMYVDGHKAASDVRDEFVSVTEKLMDELAQCYNVLPQ